MLTCNNKSVGVIIKDAGNVFLIKRKNFPYGFACPAGHVEENESYEDGALREVREETGFDVSNLKLIFSGKKDLPCKNGGKFHIWKIFSADVVGGILKMQDLETSDGDFYDRDFIAKLMQKTEKFLRKEISDEDWKKDPGMEIVWYEFFKELKL